MKLVTAHELCKKFSNQEVPALDTLNFSIEGGKITGLVGPDGAGKTTLIRIIAGLLKSSSGILDIQSDSIGYMPQQFGLYEELSVEQNLSLYASLQEIENTKNRIEELLDFTDLKPFRTRKAGDLSGGMKQKLGLACALIKKPKLLLLDEPSVGVDPISRRALWAMVQTLLEEDIAVLWGTSYLDEADHCDDIILLNEGKMLYYGTPEAMKQPLANEVYLIENISTDKRLLLSHLLESPNIMDAVLVGDSIRVNLMSNSDFPANTLQKIDPQANFRITDPTFEDAFIKMLGVKTLSHSLLAEQMQQKPSNDKKLIEATSLTKKFGDFTATDNIDFSIGSGEIFGFLGPNGAGKSTTFKMLCGLLTPTQGTATVLGENLYLTNTHAREEIGYMAQKFSLYQTLSVKDNLEFFAGIYGLSRKEQKKKIDAIIETFNFTPHLHTTTELLPLGIKQRLALSCALMHEPSVLFLDEPTSGVDPITRKEFWTHINGIIKKGISVMVTTHFMDEAQYCDRVMLIYQGKAIATGTPDELKHQVSRTATMEEAFIGLIEEYEKRNHR
ncbi:ATP-binding cassette domain-containing protein [Sulfurimonas sp. C5]|uniref:ATP-binding cassette domain-containing protein n=1 Tax=Sulfurimonas sp. C5 TaxID=3036947 RepID=UPI002453A49E|nr:ATP-binding cassette domain-containing protein [Sulfurimonas sp. C5]MDH4945023.1 ATP-binding cassette domain-containing protein [Sulfurimonas sp. C5]